MTDTVIHSGLQHVYSKWEKSTPWSHNMPKLQGNGGYSQVIEDGRKAWRRKFGDNLAPPPVRKTRQQKKRRDQSSSLTGSDSLVSGIGQFKETSTLAPVVARNRPLMGRCCTCLTQSRESLFENGDEKSGLHNILFLPASDRDLISKHCRIIAHTLSRPLNHKYPDISIQVLLSPRVTEAIIKTIEENSCEESPQPAITRKHLKAKAERTMSRMKATISNRLIRLAGWFLHKLLGRLLDSIVVHKGQMRMLKKAVETGKPVIYLPTHRSHLDYILLTFIVYHWDIRAPHVAAGENLNIAVFGRLMKGLGGFFIRRTLDKSGRKDHVYRALLQTYMEELMCGGEHLEFFMEGTRSRSGKAVYPKGGLLSVIVDSYIEGKISDAYLVPVSISYDKIMDGDFNTEQMGQQKIRETFWRACVAIWQVFNANFGNVRVDFGQPFSLKEYLQVAQSFSASPSVYDKTVNQDIADCMIAPVCGQGSPRSSDPFFYGTDIVVEDMRSTIQGLADHVVYDQVNTQAVMSTHLLAFLFLTKHRNGATISEIVQTFDWLKAEIVSKKRDLGFIGNTREVIAHACRLLGDLVNVTSVKTSQDDSAVSEGTTLRPMTSLPRVFELYYYASNVMTVFIMDSILANALYAEVEPDVWISEGLDSSIEISKQSLLERAVRLAQLLKYDFMLKPLCSDWETVFADSLEAFLCSDILRTREEADSQDRRRYHTLANSLSCGDDASDDEGGAEPDTVYKLNVGCCESMGHFWLLKRVLGPVLECYHITACHLVQLLNQNSMPEKEFITKVHESLKERAQLGAAQFTESAALDTVKNCVRALDHHNIISLETPEVASAPSLPVFSLAEGHSASTRVNTIPATPTQSQQKRTGHTSMSGQASTPSSVHQSQQRYVTLSKYYACAERLHEYISELQGYRSL